MNLTNDIKMMIAKDCYCYDYGEDWQDLTCDGKQDYIEGYIDPVLVAIDKADYKIVPKSMVCHW